MKLPFRLAFLALLIGLLGPVRSHASDADGRSAPMSLSDTTDAETPNCSGEEQLLPFSAGLSLDELPTSHSADEPAVADSASDSQELAKKVANPISNLISVPFQSNFSWGGGVDIPSLPRPLRLLRHVPGIGGIDNPLLPKALRPFRRFPGLGGSDASGRLGSFGGRHLTRLLALGLARDDREQAFQYKLNLQPVIPISLNKDWNVISRTILPVYAQHDEFGSSSQGGLGDILQSLFFSPKSGEPFLWGVGPVFLIPTSTDHNLLGSYRWGMGPTGVILKQSHGFTLGTLANHIWGFQRDDGRANVNATYLQPFLTYTTKTATTFGVSSESTYDWNESQWTIPIIPQISQIVRIGKIPVSLQLAGQYWVEKPDSAPDWGMRFQIQFLFPK
ncbi:MAG TPA: hypothetical protein VMV81_03295 [Phycisphaerae bacterium]|nr:hypothetical protein [Phycisphaerae bacterium]